MNYGIIKNPELFKEINAKIDAIADCLLSNVTNSKYYGLMGGKAGEVLFWAYYSQYSDRINTEIILKQLITQIIDNIRSGNTFPTYAEGLAGIGWILEHLKQKEILEIDTDKIIGSLDEALYPFMLKSIQSGNYDYLHGALGIGLYYLNRFSNLKAKIYITDLIIELEKQSIQFSEGIAWESEISDGDRGYNLGLSHGIASIISILSCIYLQKIETDRIRNLVTGAVDYLLSNQNKEKTIKYQFPGYVSKNYSKDNNHFGRLSWCYYDLGIAMALWRAGHSFNNELWKRKAIEILLNAADIRDWRETHIDDAGLCHGTSGVAHIFNRAYYYTGIEKFRETSIYWFEKTLKFSAFEDGLAGYKTFRSPEYGGLFKDFSFLEGITGIGLAMISSVTDICPNWDGSLLIS